MYPGGQRSAMALRHGTLEDPAQMMPSLGAPTPTNGNPGATWNSPSGLQCAETSHLGSLPPMYRSNPPMGSPSRLAPLVGTGAKSPWSGSRLGAGEGAAYAGASSRDSAVVPEAYSRPLGEAPRHFTFDTDDSWMGLGAPMPSINQYPPYASLARKDTKGAAVHAQNDGSCISDSYYKSGGDAGDAEPRSGASGSLVNCRSDAASLMAAYEGKNSARMSLAGASNHSIESSMSARSISRSSSLVGPGDSKECRSFTAAQILKATEGFSDAHVLGRGAFGSVFMGKLMGCKVAVKRLESNGWQGPSEYRMEVQVLSRMRHPHLLLLMGHCPEEHCLVYEYLPGGSLQDFLNPTKRKRALAWSDRVRVLSEIASALLYLHQHEPPIAHRDLKPDNVLLDSNLTSKLGDVGLAKLVEDDASSTTTSIRGTAGYIDPEEVVTCQVSVLADVYAFGLMALQLLMGEPNVKNILALLVDCGGALWGRALSHAADVIVAHLDPTCGTWNKEIARQLAVLALRCCNHKRLHRPDIAEEIQPVILRLAEDAGAEVQKQQQGLEAQLICPLSKVMMTDPVVAADGFTYERSAIDSWLLMNDMSPSTGKPMQHKFLMPNNGVRQLLKG